MLQGSVIVEKLYQQIRRIRTVYPFRYILDVIGLRLPCDRIAQNHLSDRLSPEQSDIELLYRSDPVRNPLFVDFKA